MIEFLRRQTVSLLIFIGLGGATTVAAAPMAEQLTRAQAEDLQREVRLVVDLLQNHHYAGKGFRQLDSATMINRFLSELDPRAEFLDQSDAEYLHRRFDRTLKSVYLFRGDLQPAFEIFDRFAERARTRLAWTQERLDRGFDFTLEEALPERKEAAPFKNQAAADRYWELQLKAQVLGEILRGRQPPAAVAEIKRHYERTGRLVAAYDPLAVRERFFDAIIRSYDPHSGYFSSDSTREFAMEMEKAVVGLGLELRKEEGRCIVSGLQPGGPADLTTGIEAGDIIESLAEGMDGPWVDLARLRLREIAGLMRGAAGSSLRIGYRHAGQSDRLEVLVVRNRIELAADRVSGAVSDIPAPSGSTRRIGWIRLPSFYAAGEGSALSSAARDVRELLGQMDPAKLDGLVLDLRGNPGGALTEAVAMSELFLPRGLVMLSRGMDGKIKQHAAKEGTPLYSGPLVVLISPTSASASEVFSAAMRFHRRAIIAGSSATFGKGTVQAYIELAKLPGQASRDWGTLRVTTEKFFQPDGNSVQGTGVAAHVPLPVFEFVAESQREVDLPGALPAEAVAAPAGTTPGTPPAAVVSDELIARLRETAAHHTQELPEWQLLRQEHALWNRGIANKTPSLQLVSRQEEWSSRLTAWHDLTLQRRRLRADGAYATRSFDLPATQQLIAAEDARLRAPAETTASRFRFVVTTDHDHRRRLDPTTIDFSRYVADAPALATALDPAGASPWDAATLVRFLREADLLRYKTTANLVSLAREIMPPDEDDARFLRRLTELVQQVATLDGELLCERPALDVTLREALRLAAAWNANPPAPSP